MPLTAEYISGMPRVKLPGSAVPRRLIGIRKQVWTDPAAAVTNGYATSHAGASAAGTRDMTLGGSLAASGADYAKNVVITVTHGTAVVAMSGTIYGVDVNGMDTSEAWSVTAGTTSKTFTGAKAFKRVTRITETVAADASTNTIIAGTGVVLGLDTPGAIGGTGVALKEIAAGSLVTTGVLVAGSAAAAADRSGTYTPATAPNGSNDYTLIYLVDDAAE